MPLTSAAIAEIVAALPEQAAVIAESLNQCFSTKFALEFGAAEPFPGPTPSEWQSAGLVVHLGAEGSQVLALLPESLPLPGWYSTPDDSQAARMQTLAMEWSLNSLPPSLTSESYGALRVPSLG